MAKKRRNGNAGKAGSRTKKAAERRRMKRKEVVFGAALGDDRGQAGAAADTMQIALS